MVKVTKTLVLFIIILGVAAGFCIVNARPMLCKYTTFINGEFKTKNTLCLQHPRVKQQKQSTQVPAATETEIVYPTLTETDWSPWLPTATGTRWSGWITDTPEPYIPPEETGEPYP